MCLVGPQHIESFGSGKWSSYHVFLINHLGWIKGQAYSLIKAHARGVEGGFIASSNQRAHPLYSMKQALNIKEGKVIISHKLINKLLSLTSKAASLVISLVICQCGYCKLFKHEMVTESPFWLQVWDDVSRHHDKLSANRRLEAQLFKDKQLIMQENTRRK